MRNVLIASMVVPLLIAGVASAQTTTNNPPMRVQGIDPMPRLDLDLVNRTRPRAAPTPRDQSPRRVRRAEHAAELINRGDCAGARTFAVGEGDEALAARVEQLCSA